MTQEGLETYLWAGVVICGILTLLNLFMVRKRGRPSAIMAAASFDVGIALLLYIKLGPSVIVYLVAAMGLGALVYHALLVNAERQAKRKF